MSKLAGQINGNIEGTLAGQDPYVSSSGNRYSTMEPKDQTTALHKHNIAFQTRLDLYSSYSRVQSFLNKLANERSAGRVSAGVGLSNVFSGLLPALEQQVSLTLKNKSLEELNVYHLELLNRLRISSTAANAFIQNQTLSPAQNPRVLVYLNEIRQVNRLETMIKLTLQAENELMAMAFCPA